MTILNFLLNDVPTCFHTELDKFCVRWQEAADKTCQQKLESILQQHSDYSNQLARTLVASEYVAKTALEFPEDFVRFVSDDCVNDAYSSDQLFRYVDKKAKRDSDEQFNSSLRAVRREFMWWIIWRDVNRLATLEQTTAALSDFASACLQVAVDFFYQQICQQWGVPIGERSQLPQPFIVLGMGKLGASELNLSSDIDLIFAYPESGETQSEDPAKVKQSKSNQEFFLKLGQKVIQSIDTVTAEGFVFRVDMRLRPYGDSGALVMNFLSLENYYETQGREWERYAMIKARPVAQASEQVLSTVFSYDKTTENYTQQLMTLLRSFTYRMYVDYSAFDSLREMKRLINKEVQRKGLREDVKLGAGGIREVEFIAQAFQLIRGGRDAQLQERSLLKVLPILSQEGMLPSEVVDGLLAAYQFLRNTEHAIQAFQDRQTQSLPPMELDQLRLAWVMGFETWEDFFQQLQDTRNFVRQQFEAVIADPEDKLEQSQREDEWTLLWSGSLSGSSAYKFLFTHGIEDGDVFCQCLNDFRKSRPVLTMQATARDRLDLLMPPLLADIGDSEQSTVSLRRICPLLEAIARRSVYLVLLQENPSARTQLAKLCAASPLIAKQLCDHPDLLDELLDAASLYSPPELSELKDQLRREVLRISWDDLEGQMEALRYFHRAHALRVAACEVMGTLPLMKVSDYLTWLAEVILQHVLELCWQQLSSKYGAPQRKHNDEKVKAEFIIVAYGKMGGIELGHGSDLDLVFIHNGDNHLSTDGAEQGKREIDNLTFFTRLGQKIIHVLNTYTVSGQLYEVDMRLRPSGNKGLLVSSLVAFEKYQNDDAWVWEHQALVRARVVAGSSALTKEFEQLRQEVLCRQRDLPELKDKVVEMRNKMRDQLGTKGEEKRAEQFHLKQDGGGIVDIEFMVQYAVLAWAHNHPGLVQYTDNIRILESLEQAQLLPSKDANRLIEIYITYRSTVHSLALQGVDSIVSGEQLQLERADVAALWQRYMLDAN